MKLGLKSLLALGALYLVIASWFVTRAFHLMNASSDVSVLAGLILLIVLCVATSWLAPKFFREIRRMMMLVPLLIISFLSLSNSGCTRVDVGHVGIRVNLAGSNRGVDDIPIVTGWVWYNPFTENVFEYPTYVQTGVWTKDPNEGSPQNEELTFGSKEGMVISADISLSYQLEAQKVPAFYVKFRSDDLKGFTHGFLRNIARDGFNEIAGKLPMEDLYGPKKEEFINAVKARVNDAVSPIGVHLEQFGFIGAVRPPPGVIEAINAKISATQRAIQAENELRQAEAEAKKVIAKAEGDAEANRRISESLTPELLQWRTLDIMERRWDGRRPMVEGSGNGLLLSIPLPAEAPTP